MAVRPVVANLVLLCGSLFVTFGILELSLRLSRNRSCSGVSERLANSLLSDFRVNFYFC